LKKRVWRAYAVVVYALSKGFQAVTELLAFGKEHVPFTAEEDNIVGESFKHAVGCDAGAKPGVCEVERWGLEVRIVEEFGEDCGEILVGTDAGGAALGAGLSVVCGWVEGDDAADLDDGVGAFGHD
jgi:hypothetical protein